MEDDQQFCLRWNNHQSTLVAVFDTLLENGTLVDCTLAAEGKYLNAHKVVLSACSPYFESLLSQNYDKHPIFILKDVKYQELKAMMDYMYRGEVNISQDQLGALLKAAESLQIKGLSDNRKGETETRKTAAPPPPPAKSPPPAAATSIPRVQGLTIEQRRREMEESREGSQSPGARKKKRIRRRSLDDLVDNHHDASNSSESHHSSQAPAQNIPTTLPAAPVKIVTDVPEPIETKADILTRHKSTTESEVPQVPIIKEKLETHSELMLEPKAEYIDEMNEDSIEDLTLDDDDISNMEQMDDQGAGPSHGNMGEGSGQGFGGWHMGNQSQDEVFLAAQEAVGAHRDSQADLTMVRKYVADTDFTENEDDMTGRGRMRKKTCIKILKNSHSSNLSSSEEEEDRGNSPPHKWKKVVLNSSMQSTRETMDPLQERSGDPLPAIQGSVNSLHPIQEPVQAIDLENIPIEFLNTLSPSIRSFIATPVSSVSSFSAAASKDDIIYSKIFSVCSHIKLAVENISERLKKIEEGSPLAMDDDTGEIEQLLPLNSKESLDSFEIFLSDDFNIQKIRSFIKRIGGRDGKDLLIRLLKRCFTNELAIKCSWLGQRNNIKVCDLKLIRLIKGVVTSQFKDYKEHALDAAASDWFRHAKLRFSREKLERKP